MLHMIRRNARRTAAVLVLGAALVPAACGDDPTDPDPDPALEVAAVRLTVGTQTVTVNGGGVTGGPISLAVGAVVPIVATWIRADGTTVTGLESEFQLRVIPANASIVSFNRTGTFAGTLHADAAGTTNLQIQLYHIEEQHGDFDKLVQVVVE